MIEFRTLGGVDLVDRLDGRRLRSILAGPKRLAVLAYLATARPIGYQRRDRILALFWPDARESRARRSLNQTLYVLRQGLGSRVLLSRGDEEIAIDPGLLTCDANEFRARLAGEDLEGALELYAGDFLAGFHLDGARDFEQWLDAERERLRRDAASATRELVDASSSPVEAVRWAREGCRLAPFDEPAHGRLISLLAETGNVPGAIREHEAFAKRLRIDLGLEPSGATRELYERIRNASSGPPARPPELDTCRVPERRETAPAERTAVSPRDSREPGRAEASRAGARAPSIAGPPAWGTLVIAVLVVAAALLRPGTPPDPEPRRVLVFDVRNEAGDPRFDASARLATDWILQAIGATGWWEVLRPPTQTAAPAGRGTSNVRSTALRLGAGSVVRGSLYRSAGRLLLRAEIAAADEEGITALLTHPFDSTSFALEMESLSEELLGALAARTDPRLAGLRSFAARPASFEAYRSFREGLDIIDALELVGRGVLDRGIPASRTAPDSLEAALAHFRRATEADSSFTLAQVWSLLVLREMEDPARADSVEAALEGRRSRLPLLDRDFFEFQQALRQTPPDRPAALRHLRSVVQLAPNAEYVKFAAFEALQAHRPDEAIELYERLDPLSEPIRSWLPYWTNLGAAYHWAGRFEDQLRLGLRMQREGIGGVEGLNQELVALAGLGRVDRFETLVDSLLSGTEAPPNLFGIAKAAAELWHHHGHQRLARSVMARVLDAPHPEADPDSKVSRARVASWVGRTHELEAITNDLYLEFGDTYLGLRQLALAPAIQGDRARTREILSRLIALPTSGAPMAAARAAALLGDAEWSLSLLARGSDQWYPYWSEVHWDPAFRSIWHRPEFRLLVGPRS